MVKPGRTWLYPHFSQSWKGTGPYRTGIEKKYPSQPSGMEVVMLEYKKDGRSRTGPRSRIFEGVWDVYHGSFPKDESEPKRTWDAVVRNPFTINSEDLYVEDRILAALRKGKVVGMSTGAYIDGKDRRILGPMVYGSYLAVRKGSRNSGVAYALYNAARRLGEKNARLRGAEGLDWIVGETDDPRFSQNVAMDPNQRLIFLDNLGFRAVDPAKFEYVQPQLTQETEPCPGLFFCINPQQGNEHSAVSPEKLLLALHRWVPGQFEALPGREGKWGRYTRDPDRDPTFQRMKKQLEGISGEIGLIDLNKFVIRK